MSTSLLTFDMVALSASAALAPPLAKPGPGQEPTLPSGGYRAVFFIASLSNAGAVKFGSTMPHPTDIGLRRIGCASVVP